MGIDPDLTGQTTFYIFLEICSISRRSPRACKFYVTSTFKDNFCTISNDGECSSSYKYIYSKQLKLKFGYLGEHAAFLDLNITIEDNMFAEKFFEKRSKFPFFTVCLPYLSRNIPSSIFYDSTFPDLLRTARCALRLTEFVYKAYQLYARMMER